MPVCTSRLTLAIALLSTVAASQRTWIVDGLNGPGAHFTDLPAAEAAAADGDILDLRPLGGPYTAITTSKGLSVMGNRSTIEVDQAPLRILGLPRGRSFTLHDVVMSADGQPARSMVEVAGCAGGVRFELLDLGNRSFDPGAGAPAIDIQASSDVTMRACRLLGSPAVRAQSSVVSANICQMLGATPAATDPHPAGVGIESDASTVSLAHGTILGGSGNGRVPGNGMIARNSTVTIGAMDPNQISIPYSQVGAGFWTSATPQPSVAAITGTSSEIRIDPVVALEPLGGAPATSGVTLNLQPVPALAAIGRDEIFLGYHSSAAAAQVSLFGIPSSPVTGPGFRGALWIAPSGLLATVTGVPSSFELTLPKGFAFVVQVVSLSQNGVELSNPAVITAP